MPVYFRIADGWCFERLPDGGGLVYHPFLGDLYALSATPCFVLDAMANGTLTREEILTTLMGTPPCPIGGERVEMEAHFDELVRLGVIISVDL